PIWWDNSFNSKSTPCRNFSVGLTKSRFFRGFRNMNRTQFVLLVLSAAALMGCNQNAGSPANPLAGDPNVNSWSSVRSADLSVPRGVSYQTVNVGGAVVADISH